MSRALDKEARYDFNLIVFKKAKDYLCYVESVHLMKHMNVIKRCSFVNDNKVFRKAIHTYQFDQLEWLSYEMRTNDFFVVIDNTDFFAA